MPGDELVERQRQPVGHLCHIFPIEVHGDLVLCCGRWLPGFGQPQTQLPAQVPEIDARFCPQQHRHQPRRDLLDAVGQVAIEPRGKIDCPHIRRVGQVIRELDQHRPIAQRQDRRVPARLALPLVRTHETFLANGRQPRDCFVWTPARARSKRAPVGQVAERLIAPVLKTGERSRVPGVRIPPCPPS